VEISDIKDASSARAYVESAGLDRIKLAVTDIDGVLRGKYVSRDKFFSALDKGFGFCDVIFGWDSNDQLYGSDSYTGCASY
jgi:glutamine synthetase